MTATATRTLSVTGVVAGGDGLAREESGRVVLVHGALPGERVVAELTTERRDLARAHVVEVLEAAPERVVPPCPHVARGCGGCGWQHVDHAAQGRLRAGVVTEALRRIAGVAEPDVTWGPPLPPAGRTTLRMGVTPDGRLAFRRSRSAALVTATGCLVAHPLLADLVDEARFPGAKEVLLRVGARTGERLVLVTPTAEGATVPGEALVVGADELAAGRRAWFHEEVAGRRWRISASSFFQARPDGAEALVAAVGEALGPTLDGHLVDAYGGVGLFAGALGRGRSRVTVVERSPSSAADARVNLAGSEPAARVLRLDVDRWRARAADAVVADPPRRGLGRAAVANLAGTGAERLALVSCDAGALGRDTALLAEAGYRFRGATLVELFPHTPQVEVVSTFERTGAAATIRTRSRRRTPRR